MRAMEGDAEEIRVADSSAASGRDGTEDVLLMVDGTCVSSCRVVPLRLRIGNAVIRVDGIGDVRTADEFRYRGYARQVMTEAVRHMEAGDAALTILYGIIDFYPKFGYVTVGPESTISLPPMHEDASLPEGYQARAFRPDDLADLQRLYERMTADTVGTALRQRDAFPWTGLLEGASTDARDDCRVVRDPAGRVGAYVWRGDYLGFVQAHSRFNPEDLILAEVAADEPQAADAALVVCRRWAGEEAKRRGRSVRHVTVFMPHEGVVAAAARQTDARLVSGYGPDGGWMARVLATGRLLAALQPELARRLGEGQSAFQGVMRVVTEVGEATVRIDGEDVRVGDSGLESGGRIFECRLPQTTLARLVMGAYPPEDLLRRLPEPVEDRVGEVLQVMFPKREAQLFLADRF